MLGRQISRKDGEILKELQTQWGSKVKIDFDMLNEPCIFFEYNSHWEIVYKLSQSGDYLDKRWHYVKQCHDAIIAFCKEEYRLEQKKKQDYKIQDESFRQTREKFIKEGFKDNLPEGDQ